jgi:hypothetical protein
VGAAAFPERAYSREQARVGMFQNLLQNTLSVVANVITRIPLHVRVAGALFSAAALAPASYANLLENTLAPTASAPFTQRDWINPQQRPFSLEALGTFNRILTNPIAPLVQTDWPNPTRQQPRVNALSYEQSTPLWVLLPPAGVSVPFAQDDWPNPVVKLRAALLPTLYRPNVEVITTVPLAQRDWPNPVLARVFAQAYTQGVPLWVQLPPSTSPPFFQTEWPNPTLKQLTAQQPTLYRPNVEVITTVPLAQEDWPNPTRARVVPQSYEQQVPLWVKLPPVATFPFVQGTSANPQLRQYSLEALGTFNRILINPVAPFAQTFWPNPMRMVAKNNAATMFRSAIGSDAPPDPGGGYSDYHRHYRRVSYR